MAVNIHAKCIWLALSGGGFRAAVFHYGCLKRLRELGLLPKVYAISAASGGALAAALLASNLQSPIERRGEPLDYDWERFETSLLSAATGGILSEFFLLLWANICYTTAILFLLWSEIVGPSPDRTILSALLGLGLVAHCALVLRLLRSPAISSEPSIGARLWQAVRIAASIWRPSRLRWYMLHHMLYERKKLGELSGALVIYLAAVDLDTGREIVFSNRVAGELDNIRSLKCLWKQEADGSTPEPGRFWRSSNYDVGELPVALAVAASSAYPPFFRPVAVRLRRSPIGHFVDGGVLDNHALSVPRRMAKEITPDRAIPELPFVEATSFVLAIDAAAPLQPKISRIWPAFSVLRRIVDIVYELQTASATATAGELQDIRNVPSALIGLQVGIPWRYDRREDGTVSSSPLGAIIGQPNDDIIAKLAVKIRTHFDRFSATECAVLAYLGYLWTDYWAQYYLPEARPSPLPALAPFRNILPEAHARRIVADESIIRHLAFSDLRSGTLRACWRGFAAIIAKFQGWWRRARSRGP